MPSAMTDHSPPSTQRPRRASHRFARAAGAFGCALALATATPLAAEGGAAGVPTFTGKGRVNEAIDGNKGALFDIGGGSTMYFPPGIPVGSSRLVTLSRGKRPPAKAIGTKFKPLGPTLDFNGAFSTSGRPMVVTVRQKRNPKKKGMRIVLAVEVGTFCEAHNKKYKLKSGLCSGWELHDASFDARASALVAKLASSGGLRMQFGLAPEADDSEDDESA